MECIPAIDLRRGGVVRLQQGDFARATGYAETPLQLAKRYTAAGARRLHVVDLDSAAGEGSNLEAIQALCGLPGLRVQTGGGVRDEARVEALLAAGADAVVGTLAVQEPAQVRGWLSRHGGEKLVLACDVRCETGRAPEVMIEAWRRSSGLTLWQLLAQYRDAGLRKVLCTDVGQDGLLQGPNVALYRECTARFPSIEWQASGGVSGSADLSALAASGVAAAIVGRAFLEGRIADSVLATAL